MTDRHLGVKGVLLKDGQVLLLQRIRRSGHQHWDLPGGYIEGGEDPTAALLREVAEEVPSARQVRIVRPLTKYQLRPPRQGTVQVYLIAADLDRTEISQEHVGHLWVAADHYRRLTETHPQWHLPAEFAAAIEQAWQATAS